MLGNFPISSANGRAQKGKYHTTKQNKTKTFENIHGSVSMPTPQKRENNLHSNNEDYNGEMQIHNTFTANTQHTNHFPFLSMH